MNTWRPMPEPCGAQGARVAGQRYADQLQPGHALVLRHSGAREARWWLVAMLPLADCHLLYETTLAALPRDSTAALAVWFDGGSIRFGELCQGTASRFCIKGTIG